MHEVSLVRSLISQAIDAAKPLLPACIRTVRVSVGPLTGVEPLLVQQAFDAHKRSSGLAECELEIDEQSLAAVCLECELAFEVVNYIFRCPSCTSGSVKITQGDEFRLLSIEVDESMVDSQSVELTSTEFSAIEPQLTAVLSTTEGEQDE
jgi:hydrogenase nickel incorporation protein HypA/HybF